MPKAQEINGVLLPCPRCGEAEASITMHMADASFTCRECDGEFTAEEMSDIVIMWSRVLKWVELMPKAAHQQQTTEVA